MSVNEKYKTSYSNRFKSFLFMGTNRPVKITDAKSGLLRRLIDVSPTGDKLPQSEYASLTKQIDFELGAIAYYCKGVFLNAPEYYDSYVPKSMMGASNDFYNFIIDSYHIFKKENGVSLKVAWEMYKTYCEEARVPHPLTKMYFKEEFKNYFSEYLERLDGEDGSRIRSYYSGFKTDILDGDNSEKEPPKTIEKYKIDFCSTESIFDKEMASCPAQYASSNETPIEEWKGVRTTLSDIDTSKLHYVKTPENHIVIDFDIPDETGKKCYEKNLEAASKWPPTYAEVSKSGAGIHLHYKYSGDSSKLARVYEDHVEIKVFNGKSSLRRKLSKCNELPITTISSGLPIRGEKVINFDSVQNEKHLRSLIEKNLKKEIHPNTKPSIDFIYEILEGAYNNGMTYDVTDMYNSIMAFALHSTNKAEYCINAVNKMRFKSEDASDPVKNDDKKIVFYDIEVFPNLLLINWKPQGLDKKMVRMINPTPADVEALMKFRLIGFNCRKYDNHILYARMMGYSNEEIYKLSKKIISNDRSALFGEAYNISFTDIYDFSSEKKSLKKWEIEMASVSKEKLKKQGFTDEEINTIKKVARHQELGLSWDLPVPEELWIKVSEYCDNDVRNTEALFTYRKADWTARQILADVAGMTVNDTTNTLTTRIIFGKEKKPTLVYTDLATGKQTGESTYIKEEYNAFPGYEFKYIEEDKKYHNLFLNTDVGLGGYVYANVGLGINVAVLDVASMHPHSAIAMNCFGEYTKNFENLIKVRICIKHKEYDKAALLFDGKLSKYLEDPAMAKALSVALKIAINSVYGLTAARFPNTFKDYRNKNNIIALRGALFMRLLQSKVDEFGYTVVHIKTDSIKIAEADNRIISYCMDFAKKYGYTFEHESSYEKICLVNDAVYIAKYSSKEFCERRYGYIPEHNQELAGTWTPTGTQFQVPYVFKTLFSHEPIELEDLCEIKSVGTAIYLDMNEDLLKEAGPDYLSREAEFIKLCKKYNNFEVSRDVSYGFSKYTEKEKEKYMRDCARYNELKEIVYASAEKIHSYKFIGKVGQFCPIKPGCGGGLLLREDDGKYSAVGGSKGYRWKESEIIRQLGTDDIIDKSYYQELVDKAVAEISKYCDFEWFVSDDTFNHEELYNPSAASPWDEACSV